MRLRKYGWALIAAGAIVLSACDRPPAAGSDASDRGTVPPAGVADRDADRNDAVITTTIQGKYFASDAVKGQTIDVTTRDGVVTLSGSVESDQARQEAVQIARDTEGVSRVTDNLSVGAANQTPQAGSGQRTADGRANPAWITTKLQAQYFVNPDINPFRIDVTTSGDGVVTLAGTVDSEEDRAEAVRLAREVDGVTDVRDNLRVEGRPTATTGTVAREGRDRAETGDTLAERAAEAGQTFTDGWITAKVQSKYFLDSDVKSRNIDVDTAGGVVTLRGTVGSYGERQQAVSMARNTDGVREVRDELRVDSRVDETAASNGAAAARRMRGAAAAAGESLSDAWITTRVQSKYFVNDHVRGGDIDVDTKNRVVTLTGTVQSDEAKRTAEALASETDGVTRVVNRLAVSGGQ